MSLSHLGEFKELALRRPPDGLACIHIGHMRKAWSADDPSLARAAGVLVKLGGSS